MLCLPQTRSAWHAAPNVQKSCTTIILAPKHAIGVSRKGRFFPHGRAMIAHLATVRQLSEYIVTSGTVSNGKCPRQSRC